MATKQANSADAQVNLCVRALHDIAYTGFIFHDVAYFHFRSLMS